MFFHKTKTIIIAGASRFGAGLAGKLSGRSTRIVVIDLNEDAFRKLPEDFSGYQIVGDGTDIDLLKQVGIESAEVFSRLNDKNKEKLIRGFNIKPICPFVLSVNEFDRLTEGEYQEAGIS